MIIKQTSTKGFDPIGVYGIYDRMSGNIIGIHTFANDMTAKTNIIKNMEKDLGDTVHIVTGKQIGRAHV